MRHEIMCFSRNKTILRIIPIINSTYFGKGSGLGGLRPIPTGIFLASAVGTKVNSISTLPCKVTTTSMRFNIVIVCELFYYPSFMILLKKKKTIMRKKRG